MNQDQPAGNDPTAIEHARFVEGIKTGNVDAILATFRTDAIWMPQNETTLYGIDEVREWFEEYFEHFRITTYSETEREVRVTGDLAIERASYMVAIAPVKGGERIRDDGRFLTVWRADKQGSWKISQAMMNSMRAVGSGTNRFMVRMMERRNEPARDDPGRDQK